MCTWVVLMEVEIWRTKVGTGGDPFCLLWRYLCIVDAGWFVAGSEVPIATDTPTVLCRGVLLSLSGRPLYWREDLLQRTDNRASQSKYKF